MEGSVRQRPGRAGRQDLLQQAIWAHTGRRHRAVTWCPTRASSGCAHKLAYSTLTTLNANAHIASGGARPSAWRKSIQREDPAHRHEFAFCFRISSSTPSTLDKPIALPHVPRPSPCGKHFGFRSGRPRRRCGKSDATTRPRPFVVAPDLVMPQILVTVHVWCGGRSGQTTCVYAHVVR